MIDENHGCLLTRLLKCRLGKHEIGGWFEDWARLTKLVDRGIRLDEEQVESLRRTYATIALRFQAAADQCALELKDRGSDTDTQEPTE